MKQRLNPNTRNKLEGFIAKNIATLEQSLPDLESKGKYIQALTNFANGVSIPEPIDIETMVKILIIYMGREILEIDDMAKETENE